MKFYLNNRVQDAKDFDRMSDKEFELFQTKLDYLTTKYDH